MRALALGMIVASSFGCGNFMLVPNGGVPLTKGNCTEVSLSASLANVTAVAAADCSLTAGYLVSEGATAAFWKISAPEWAGPVASNRATVELEVQIVSAPTSGERDKGLTSGERDRGLTSGEDAKPVIEVTKRALGGRIAGDSHAMFQIDITNISQVPLSSVAVVDRVSHLLTVVQADGARVTVLADGSTLLVFESTMPLGPGQRARFEITVGARTAPLKQN